MALKLYRGDYVPDHLGGLASLEGQEALAQRVLFRLTARRGTFPFWETLGSRLWELGRVSPAAREAAAAQYVAEALEEEPGLCVGSVSLSRTEEGGTLVTAVLRRNGDPFSVSVEVQ